jgi:hypothetical protein
MKIHFVIKKIDIKSKQSGFVILFAMIISTIILILGSGIFSIAYKEALLQTGGTDTLNALYAADAGMDCAFYLDSAVLPAVYDCNAGTATATGVGSIFSAINANPPTAGNPVSVDFRLKYPNKTCSHITVSRILKPLPAPHIETKIYSQGYNVCDGTAPEINNPNLVERVLEATY